MLDIILSVRRLISSLLLLTFAGSLQASVPASTTVVPLVFMKSAARVQSQAEARYAERRARKHPIRNVRPLTAAPADGKSFFNEFFPQAQPRAATPELPEEQPK